MKRSGCIFLLFLFIFSLLCPFSPLHAAENEETSEWTFSATPYVWFSGLNGTVGVRGHKGRISLSFSEILSDMKTTGMMALQGRKGNQYFFFDGMYLDLSDTEQVSAAMFTDIGVKMTRLQAAWGLRVKEWESSSLDVFAGLRYWNINSDLTFRTVSVPLRHYSETESWLDPIVGFRFTKDLSPNLAFVAMANGGGFGLGSDFTWEGMVDLSWRLSDRTSLEVGYRYLYVDYENDGFVMDTYNDGFFIGFTWKF